MFCQKKCSAVDSVRGVMCILHMVVGIAVMLYYLMSKCTWLRRHAKKLACECGDAATRVAHAVKDCVTPGKNCCDTDNCCDEN